MNWTPSLGAPATKDGHAKDFVVFLRWDVTPGDRGDDRAVRERKHSFPVGLDCYVIAQNGAQIVEVAFFLATEINLQSRYPGSILIPKIGVASSSVRLAARAIKTMGQTAIAAITKAKICLIERPFTEGA
jgi:hypothetical protein